MKKSFILILVSLLPMLANAYDAEIDGIYYFFAEDEATCQNCEETYNVKSYSLTSDENGTGFVGDGYYRVRNLATQRYIYVTDNRDYYNPNYDSQDFQAFQLWQGAERAASDPASVIYIQNETSGFFDLNAQGTSLHSILDWDWTITAAQTDDGSYEVSYSTYGVTKYFSDNEPSDSDDGYMGEGGRDTYRRWIVDKIETSHATNYVGIEPTLQVGDKFYQPYYAAFPFKSASPDMHIYYICGVNDNNAFMKEIEGEIPAGTPVIIECSSADPSHNRIEPLTSTSAEIAGNLLDGTYFCNGSRPRASVDAYKHFDAATMRLFTVADGKLILTDNAEDRLTETRIWNPDDPTSYRKITGYCIPANTSYLKADTDTPAVLDILFVSGMMSDVTQEVAGIFYKLNNDEKVAEVTYPPYGYIYEGNIVIPSSITYNGDTYSVTSIGGEAFFGCSNLTSVIIGNNVTTIKGGAFAYCSGLTSITIPESVTNISGYGAFYGCSGLTSVTIPNSVTTIGDQAFYNCSSLTDVTIGNGVTSIGYQTFYCCRSLTDVYCFAKDVPGTSYDSFLYASISSATLYVPEESVDAYRKASPWRDFKNIVGLTQDMIDGIREIKNEELRMKDDGVWYSLDGKKLGEPQKGLNIIRYSDGTTRKVMLR